MSVLTEKTGVHHILYDEPSDTFWTAIRENAELALKHTNWCEYLDNIKCAVVLLDCRIQFGQRAARAQEMLLKRQKGLEGQDCSLGFLTMTVKDNKPVGELNIKEVVE